jgi:LmbE family N-acetylglucosaminyl deacetylase
MKNILVISAHPDDEVLGLGGTLLKHSHNGDKLYWVIVTNISTKDGFLEKNVEKRQKEIEIINNKIGFTKYFKLDFPTMKLDTTSLVELIPILSEIVSEIKPEIIYTMNRSDAHSDHRIVFDAILTCTKSFRYPSVKQFIMYETLSETEFAPAIAEKHFVPNYFVDISDYMNEKIDLLRIYSSELGEHPFPRSMRNIKALATYRGAFAGVEYAEAFQIVHIIDK